MGPYGCVGETLWDGRSGGHAQQGYVLGRLPKVGEDYGTGSHDQLI